jgi:hypothetical protein
MAIEDRTSLGDGSALRLTTEAAPAAEPMLIDRLMPCYDAVRTEHRIVPRDLATVYAATRRADFIRAWRDSVTVRLLFAARNLGERTVSLIARRERREPPPPESLRLADMPTHGDWVLLGEDRPTRSPSASSDASGPARPSGSRSTPTISKPSASPASERSPATSRCAPTGPAGHSSPTNAGRSLPTTPPAAASCATGGRSRHSSAWSCAPNYG